MTDEMQVLGVDGCKKGWVGVTPGPTSRPGKFGDHLGDQLGCRPCASKPQVSLSRGRLGQWS